MPSAWSPPFSPPDTLWFMGVSSAILVGVLVVASIFVWWHRREARRDRPILVGEQGPPYRAGKHQRIAASEWSIDRIRHHQGWRVATIVGLALVQVVFVPHYLLCYWGRVVEADEVSTEFHSERRGGRNQGKLEYHTLRARYRDRLDRTFELSAVIPLRWQEELAPDALYQSARLPGRTVNFVVWPRDGKPRLMNLGRHAEGRVSPAAALLIALFALVGYPIWIWKT